MHPAPSIIIFTTLSGLGFGLMSFIGLGAGPDGAGFGWAACIIAFALTVGGLLSSTLHLGHPERAWRAMSQWRTSWLSREGALAIITLALFGLYALLWLFFNARIAPLGWLAAALALVTVYATSMIYAQLKTVPRWRTHWTPAFFLGFALAGGALLAALLNAFFTSETGWLTLAALLLLLVGWGLKLGWWARAARTDLQSVGASIESATGLGGAGATVRLFESPHSAPNYLMREMVFRLGRKRAKSLRLLSLALGAAAPLLLLVFALAFGGWFWLALALISHMIGVAASRWLFFAEAEHTVSVYYGGP